MILSCTQDSVPINGNRFRNGFVFIHRYDGSIMVNQVWSGCKACRTKHKQMPKENLVKMQPIIHLPNGDIGAFAYHDSAEKALKPGDKLLVR